MEKYDTVDGYINSFNGDLKKKLTEIRSVIISNYPDLIESISYGIPAYKLNKKPIIYFAGFKNHIGLYATPTAHEHFSQKLEKYKQGKGSVQIPLSDQIPFELISEMIAFNIQSTKSKSD
jgi:uncharacterized protein YdhG (YjbR/CyaY superfamily)